MADSYNLNNPHLIRRPDYWQDDLDRLLATPMRNAWKQVTGDISDGFNDFFDAKGEIADKWEESRQQTLKELDSWVENNPNIGVILVATAVNTAMVLGAGMVDVLRIGEGFRDGGWGYGEDILRLLAIAGPVARVVQVFKQIKLLRLANQVVDPGGRRCAFVAGTKALIQTGHKINGKHAISVKELARILIKPEFYAQAGGFSGVGGLMPKVLVKLLRRINAHIGPYIETSSLRRALALLRRDGSVTILSLKTPTMHKMIRGFWTPVSENHAIYAFYDYWGKLKFMDRAGVFDSIEAIAEHYGVVKYNLKGFTQIPSVYGKYIGPSGLPILCIEILGLDIFMKEKNDNKKL